MQGLTEFLPVSSSGHLVLMQAYLGLDEPMVFFDVLLHVGTLLSVLVVYRRDIAAMARETISAAADRFKNLQQFPHARTFLMIVVANVPTALMGVTLENHFERLFGSPFIVGVMLLVTGAILFATRGKNDGGKEESFITVREALIIGVAQGCAITPGISRAGMTIAIALFLGIKRESAARFSFLLSVPAILGALLLKSRHLAELDGNLQIYLLGSAVSFIVGTLALIWLINIVKRGKLIWFSWYVWAVGTLAIVSYF